MAQNFVILRKFQELLWVEKKIAKVTLSPDQKLFQNATKFPLSTCKIKIAVPAPSCLLLNDCLWSAPRDQINPVNRAIYTNQKQHISLIEGIFSKSYRSEDDRHDHLNTKTSEVPSPPSPRSLPGGWCFWNPLSKQKMFLPSAEFKKPFPAPNLSLEKSSTIIMDILSIYTELLWWKTGHRCVRTDSGSTLAPFMAPPLSLVDLMAR